MSSAEVLQKRLAYFDHEMSTACDISQDLKPSQKYCIASTPRSGSTLISKMLLSTGLAGAPKEYLSTLLIQAWLRQRENKKNLNLDYYIRDLHARRTSPNGVFGMKIHWRQIEEMAKKISFAAIGPHLNDIDKFIFISRKDKISQAISYYIANNTGVFHSDHEVWLSELSVPQPPFNSTQILKHLRDILREEEGWEQFFKEQKKPVHRICYEEFISDYQAQCGKIFNFLTINAPLPEELPTKEMKKPYTALYKEQLLEIMGVKDRPAN